MKLSVALGTFNGEQFLPEQLESIREQTRAPDELVVCDDGSFDNSVSLIQAFAQTVRFPVRIEENPTNLGSTRNFERAIGLCTGDVIALADQDDVWLPNKLAALEFALNSDPRSGFAFSDAEMVDEQLSHLGYTLWEAIGFAHTEQECFREGQAFEALLRRHRVTGATMAFRAKFRDLLLPIPKEWVHDAWIALLISAQAGCVLVPKPLIRYRQHREQQIGGRKRGLYGQYLAAKQISRGTCEAVSRCFAQAEERLSGVVGLSEERRLLLKRKIEHHRRRAQLREPGTWRLPRILQEAWGGNYERFSLGWKAIAQDLFLG